MDSSQEVLREVGEPQNISSKEPACRPSKRARLDTPSEFMCMICCDTPPIDEAFELRCAHKFCLHCWKEYVVTKIKQEGQCFFKCMQDGCAVTVDDTSIRQLADDTAFERYATHTHPDATDLITPLIDTKSCYENLTSAPTPTFDSVHILDVRRRSGAQAAAGSLCCSRFPPSSAARSMLSASAAGTMAIIARSSASWCPCGSRTRATTQARRNGSVRTRARALSAATVSRRMAAASASFRLPGFYLPIHVSTAGSSAGTASSNFAGCA